jgi:preprotein translocase subunit SecB
MTSLPMQLENHFFTKVMVEANPAYQPEKDEELLEVVTEVQIGQHKDNPHKWRVILNLRTESTDEMKMPYKIDLECVGLFKVAPEIKEKKMPFLVRANGAAILYSSAREFLLLVTGRGPWDGFYLPTTNFLETPQTNEERKPQTKAPSSKSAKKKRVSKVKKIPGQLKGTKSEK